ncbi:threonine ammonia-lyase [Clostridium sp. A1-XYC3]|uniref:L-threonine dehydratase catabolic TdcB n=1 Tax=Clostridium tanneri TaxID=3037988 RepID=A0ABU4JSQ4_9CLOT|nr:threonine ammonia-lyase [Clostridium sp. A1-XYC3]MDW8801176.1 threonine ammonia-lyase [Clostridium sp. A1-XYC3]
MELNLERIKKAQENIKGVARKTPLFYTSTFSNQCDCNLYLKCENKQKTGAFKLRGAYNKLVNLTEEEKQKGVIASSAGNHAQGVAYAATAFGVKATIVMPVTAPQAKVTATKGYGAEVVQAGQVYDECYAKAVELQKETGATFLHPFNDLDVMAGQGTAGLEMLEELPEADVIVVPIGGGGLIAGIATAVKSIKPSIRVVGVQPEIVASTKASLEKGQVVTLPGAKSLADGISVSTPGDECFKYIQKYVDEVVTVSEDEIALGMFSLMERNKLIAEGAGASTMAALLAGKIDGIKGKNVVALISGGNVDIATVSKIIERELVLLNRRIRFTVELQDKAGTLGALISEVGNMGGNVVTARQNNNWNKKGLDFADVCFEVTVQSQEHGEEIIKSLKENGYLVEVHK